jgi:hypothetical protein
MSTDPACVVCAAAATGSQESRAASIPSLMQGQFASLSYRAQVHAVCGSARLTAARSAGLANSTEQSPGKHPCSCQHRMAQSTGCHSIHSTTYHSDFRLQEHACWDDARACWHAGNLCLTRQLRAELCSVTDCATYGGTCCKHICQHNSTWLGKPQHHKTPRAELQATDLTGC